jgi:hypothetical protein
MYRSGPKPSKDPLWEEIAAELPYTKAAQAYRTDPFFGSTAEFEVTAKQSEWIAEQPMPPIDEEAAIGFPANNNSLRHRRKKHKVDGKYLGGFLVLCNCLGQIDSLDSPKDGQENGHASDESMHSNSERSSDEHSNSSMYAKVLYL